MSAAASANESFPYTAYVTSDDVYVRSGPGKNYYPTEKLVRGSEVEVYRHDPGGWFAIRPPQGSFSWVLAADLRVLPDRPGVAEVAKDHTLAFVGSRFSDVRDVRQVKLDRGELVEILGEKRFVADGSSKAETWYRVSPPAGEFRWVAGRFVTRQGHPVPNAASVTEARSTSDAGVQPVGAIATSPRDSSVAIANSNVGAIRTVVHQQPDPTRGAVATQPAPASPAPPPQRETVGIPAAATAGAPAAPASNPLLAELDDINLKLSLMIAEEPTVWQFDSLKSRANAALNASRSALERGRASTLLRDIAKYEQIRNQYATAAVIRQQTEQRNDTLAKSAAVAAESVAPPAVDAARFDGIGRLTPVQSRRPGAPRYALTDAAGNVLTFVTPEPELPIGNYVGHVVGLSGQRGYMPQLGKPHLTAKRLTQLDPTVLR
jgi:hypothetical protein